MAYGVLAPRVVVEPARDDQGHDLVRIRTQDPITKADLHVIDIDPQCAALIAKNILDMVIQ
jgi:hypothetical protein